MSENKKNPLNVSGKYYVCQETCLDHELCVEEAPSNFRMDESSWCAYVFKQPETEEEELACKRAMEACPVEAVYNDGTL